MSATSGREVSFEGIARFDWVYFGRFNRLHAPASMSVNVDGWHAEDATLACGRYAEAAWIPGLFSRMSLPRCAQCCDALGLPRGKGSPKNDDECRALLGMDP